MSAVTPIANLPSRRSKRRSVPFATKCDAATRSLFALDPAPIVPAHGAVARDDAMARDRWVVIRAHHGADRSRSFGIARFRRDFFVGHRLPFRDLPNDRANFFGKCFHILSVTKYVGLAIFFPTTTTRRPRWCECRCSTDGLLPDMRSAIGLPQINGVCHHPAATGYRLGKNFLRLLLNRSPRADVWDRTIANARDAELGETLIRWHAIHDHDIER